MWTIRRDSSQRWHDVLPQHFFSQRYIMKKREEREKEREREREIYRVFLLFEEKAKII
jgi:hypothetical protein